MIKCYLAGPMRGLPMCNFPTFFRTARLLAEAGFTVVNPAAHDIECGFDPVRGNYEEKPELQLKSLLAWDFSQVMQCDRIILLPGWRESRGTRAELVVAHYAGLEVWEIDPQFSVSVLKRLKLGEPDIRWC